MAGKHFPWIWSSFLAVIDRLQNDGAISHTLLPAGEAKQIKASFRVLHNSPAVCSLGLLPTSCSIYTTPIKTPPRTKKRERKKVCGTRCGSLNDAIERLGNLFYMTTTYARCAINQLSENKISCDLTRQWSSAQRDLPCLLHPTWLCRKKL